MANTPESRSAARRARDVYQEWNGEKNDDHTLTVDLVADLLLAAEADGMNWESIWRGAEEHVRLELADPEGA